MDRWHSAWVIPGDRGRCLADALARDLGPPAVEAVVALLAQVDWAAADDRVRVPLDADTRERLDRAAARLGLTVVPRDRVSPWVARGLDELPRYERLIALRAPDEIVARSAATLRGALAMAEGAPAPVDDGDLPEVVARFRDLRARSGWWLWAQPLPAHLAGVSPYQEGVRFGPPGEDVDVRSTLKYLWNEVRREALARAAGWRPDVGLGPDVPFDWPELGLETDVVVDALGPGEAVLAPTFPDGCAEVVSVGAVRAALADYEVPVEDGFDEGIVEAERAALAQYREALARAPDDAWIASWVRVED